jgi:hypothetical protein
MCWQDLTAHLCLPPLPAGRLPWRTRARSWWAGVGQPAVHLWAAWIRVVVLFIWPVLMFAALLSTAIPDRPAPAAGSCTLVGSTWSCTR